MLTETQRKRIDLALSAPTRDEIVRSVNKLQTSIELHQFALNYNVNDGFRPLWAIIRNSNCDLGTAVYIYWQFANCLLPPVEIPPPESPNQEWDAKGLTQEIENRVQSGSYQCQTIAFDPRTSLGWNSIVEYRLQRAKEEGVLSFPVEMLNPTPGQVVEQEWF